MSVRQAIVAFLVAIIFAGSAIGMMPVEAAASQERRAVGRSAGNFHARASSNSEVVGTFNRGTLIRHVAQHGNSETWMSARLDGERVFVRRADIALLPRNNATDQSNRRAVGRGDRTTPIYRHPSTHAREIGSVAPRQLISNLQRWDRSGNWARVTHGDVTGFVRLSDVSLLPRNNAANQRNRSVFIRRDAAIHRHPSVHSRVVEDVTRHSPAITVRNWDRSGNWVEVRRGGNRVGFMRAANVTAPVARTAQNNLRQRVTFNADTTHFRAPSTSAPTDGYFTAGQVINNARPHNRSGTWLRATVDGNRVYFRTTNARVSYHVTTTNNAELNRELERALNRLVNNGMTRPQMRRAVYNDTVRRMVWVADPVVLESGWRERRALRAFTTNRGNCFGYAARFGFLAQAIGYDARIIAGQVRGRGGPVPHAWVEIRFSNGRVFVYDPQLEQQTGLSFYHMPRGRERAFYLR